MVPEAKPNFWGNVKADDNIILGDFISRRQRMAEGKGPTPESYRISEIMIVRNSLADWRFFRLSDSGLFLLAKTVDKLLSLSVLKDAEGWNAVTRREILGTELDFIFTPPDPSQIDAEKGFIGDPNSLRFTADLEHNEVEYGQKPQGEQNGGATFSPARSGVSGWQATIVEYAASAEQSKTTEEPEAMILEIGEPGTGVIQILTGRPLKLNDVKVMQPS